MIQKLDIKYAEPDCCFLDAYIPEDIEKPPVYIFFHGGGIEGGSRQLSQYQPTLYTNAGFSLVSVEYRMYPNTKFPEYIIDCANAVKYVSENFDFGDIIIGGDSAGAYLAMMLYFNKDYLKYAKVDFSRIKGYIFNAGQPTSHFNYLKYDKKIDSRCVLIDEAAPIYYLRENYTENEPYIMFICAERDMTNRLNQTNVIMTAMKQFKFPEKKLIFKYYENETHCSYLNKDYFNTDVIEFIKLSTGGTK